MTFGRLSLDLVSILTLTYLPKNWYGRIRGADRVAIMIANQRMKVFKIELRSLRRSKLKLWDVVKRLLLCV